MSEENLLISFLLIVRNEGLRVGNCLGSMLDQTLDKHLYEIIVVDGMSQDSTREVVEKAISDNPDRGIRLLDNPRKILSTGWNIGIREARGEFVIRPDAHGEVPQDFLERNLYVMQRHPEAWAVGGILTTVGKGFWGEAIAAGLACRMGVGGSSFRIGGKPGPAEAVVFALYRRDRLLEIGGFDEGLPLNQDNACHGKIRQMGGVLYFDPSIRSTYFCRDSLSQLWRQMFRRSIWLMLILKHQSRKSLAIRYFIPLAFVLFLFAASIVGAFWSPALWIGASALGLYILTGWLFALKMKLSFLQKISLPAVFLTTHTAYGLGSIVGLVRLIGYRPRASGSEISQ